MSKIYDIAANWYWSFLKRVDEAKFQCDLIFLAVLNRITTRRVTADGGPVVSLTTWGVRTKLVYLTIESIARGQMRPSRLVLWLDNAKEYYNLPESIKRLQRRGLEVCLTENFGPHTKYYPYVETEEQFRAPLVTADDDIIYHSRWLQDLYDAHVHDPSVIHCFRARRIISVGNELSPYIEWPLVTDTSPRVANFLTGVSGVIYAPFFLELLKAEGRSFQGVCPRADDIWLNVIAIRNRVRVRQVAPASREFRVTPRSQSQALFVSNQLSGGNDEQLAKTLTTADLEIILKEIGANQRVQ